MAGKALILKLFSFHRVVQRAHLENALCSVLCGRVAPAVLSPAFPSQLWIFHLWQGFAQGTDFVLPLCCCPQVAIFTVLHLQNPIFLFYQISQGRQCMKLTSSFSLFPLSLPLEVLVYIRGLLQMEVCVKVLGRKYRENSQCHLYCHHLLHCNFHCCNWYLPSAMDTLVKFCVCKPVSASFVQNFRLQKKRNCLV